MKQRIYLSLAHMGGREQDFIKEAFDTNWVVPLGPNVDAFEKELSAFLGQDRHVVALSAGTAAIHLGLLLSGVEKGDEVICQSFTFAASANPVTYLGATPVFVDSESETWNMSPEFLEIAIKDRIEKNGKKPKAILPVHLYGMPAKMDEIISIARKYEIPIMEDAAEAIGSEYNGRKCGTYGEFGALSFNGNKMITTSGGGALVCRTEEEAHRAMFFATQAREPRPYYYHEYIGYNYRMSNICAGIGRGQMLVLDRHIARRREIHKLYTVLLGNIPGVKVMQNPSFVFDSNFWLTCITLDRQVCKVTPDEIRKHLEQENIESRLLWRPMHMQPVFKDCLFYGDGTSEQLFQDGLCLPSGSVLSDNDIARVVEEIGKIISR
ncbi:DegT/DnrJ/EryC1/StrS family aminotransferase [Coprobacter tertius]|uniref:Aminotransferase class I/II-fold pyridoxal phosphate-dependent enzyme n=1 Tax=Coprobacter tertius TaxID=2944915 RepID=A0ABT1MK64_9BACT|nr:aminotransferase class I/II-fold pyridoxal phosphate-dependent enzyme [Coprobacter tertius]MCP9613018.1 aminotransferase class I/II-fold pyridoxal phosphate-dependent enzyme [Coprobacter tertius]